MSIQRYDLVCRDWELYDLEPDDHGDWCQWSEVEPLVAERDALAARVREMEAMRATVREALEEWRAGNEGVVKTIFDIDDATVERKNADDTPPPATKGEEQ